jgi:hypothetical protein
LTFSEFKIRGSLRRGVALIGRAAVSKTVGWGFESLHPCH